MDFSYSLELTIMSAEALTMAGKKPVNKNVFVTISTGDHQVYDKQQQQTKISEEGGRRNPTWNEKLVMAISTAAKFFVVEVHYKTRTRDKTIGIAKVPISDFIGDFMPRNYLNFLSYRLRDPYGEPNGIINFSVKVKSLDYEHYENYNHGFMGSSEIKGPGYRQNCMSKTLHSTPFVVDWNNAAVGIPAPWYNPLNPCHI